jgi:simple sugar transport system permease protein
LLGLVVWAYFRFTRAGLEHAAIGESPEAADSAGVSVQLRKLGAILFGAACAGLAGAYLSTMRVWAFTENMTDGMGFLALAIVIFGRWSAWGILLAGLFFGLVRAGVDALNVSRFARADLENLFNMLPYALSLAALAGLAGRSPAPAALGKVWAR